jgi:murein DD-endopeptidase MepM/ murein hydrolase activator NlpD
MSISREQKLKRIFLSACLVFTVVGLGLFAATASGSDLSDEAAAASDDPLATYREKQQELQDQMDALKEQITAQSNLIEGYEDELADIEAKMLTVQAQLDAMQVGIDDANAQIAQAEADIAEAEVRLAERRAYLEQRLVDVYIYGDVSFMDVVFETDSFDDFIALFDMMQLVMDQDRHMMNEITKELNTIKYNKAKMEKMRDELVVMTYDYQDMQLDLAALQDQKMVKMQEAMSTKEGYIAALEEFEAASEQVSAQIRDYLATSGDTLSYGGSMIWPLPSPWGKDYITSPYGNRYHPISGDYRMHTGIDIAADGGTPIYAAADGEVFSLGWISGYGNTVQINHGDGITTLYAHMSRFGTFKSGDYVLAGDTIGYVGTTGNSTGNHLHFEVRVNGNHTDPMSYLN